MVRIKSPSGRIIKLKPQKHKKPFKYVALGQPYAEVIIYAKTSADAALRLRAWAAEVGIEYGRLRRRFEFEVPDVSMFGLAKELVISSTHGNRPLVEPTHLYTFRGKGHVIGAEVVILACDEKTAGALARMWAVENGLDFSTFRMEIASPLVDYSEIVHEFNGNM